MKMRRCQRLRNPVPKDTNEGVGTVRSVPSDESMKPARVHGRYYSVASFRGEKCCWNGSPALRNSVANFTTICPPEVTEVISFEVTDT